MEKLIAKNPVAYHNYTINDNYNIKKEDGKETGKF